jgi:hypothetical protein
VRACPQADAAKVRALVALRDRLDPFALAARIDRKLARLYALANHRRGQPSTYDAGGAEAGAGGAATLYSAAGRRPWANFARPTARPTARLRLLTPLCVCEQTAARSTSQAHIC